MILSDWVGKKKDFNSLKTSSGETKGEKNMSWGQRTDPLNK